MISGEINSGIKNPKLNTCIIKTILDILQTYRMAEIIPKEKKAPTKWLIKVDIFIFLVKLIKI